MCIPISSGGISSMFGGCERVNAGFLKDIFFSSFVQNCLYYFSFGFYKKRLPATEEPREAQNGEQERDLYKDQKSSINLEMQLKGVQTKDSNQEGKEPAAVGKMNSAYRKHEVNNSTKKKVLNKVPEVITEVLNEERQQDFHPSQQGSENLKMQPKGEQVKDSNQEGKESVAVGKIIRAYKKHRINNSIREKVLNKVPVAITKKEKAAIDPHQLQKVIFLQGQIKKFLEKKEEQKAVEMPVFFINQSNYDIKNDEAYASSKHKKSEMKTKEKENQIKELRLKRKELNNKYRAVVEEKKRKMRVISMVERPDKNWKKTCLNGVKVDAITAVLVDMDIFSDRENVPNGVSYYKNLGEKQFSLDTGSGKKDSYTAPKWFIEKTINEDKEKYCKSEEQKKELDCKYRVAFKKFNKNALECKKYRKELEKLDKISRKEFILECCLLLKE